MSKKSPPANMFVIGTKVSLMVLFLSTWLIPTTQLGLFTLNAWTFLGALGTMVLCQVLAIAHYVSRRRARHP